MAKSILSRYIDAEVLGKVQGTPVKPRGLVMGNLAGAHKSPLHGFAVEFAGHREYVIGDDTRHIDWRVFYKRDKYFIKQYEMETNFTAHLVLDVSASMRYGEEQEQKMLYAAQMLTTLGYSIIKQSDRVSLSTFDEKICGYVPPGNSMALVQRMTEHLDEIEPKDKTDMSECLSEVAGRTGRREIIMIFSDFFTDLESREREVLGCVVPDDVQVQLERAVGAVFQSWNSRRAKAYRKINYIHDHWGTTVNIQVMVFGLSLINI